MAATRGTRVPASVLRDAEPYSPSARHLAAFQRMAREPDLLASFDPEDWVAFAGEQIVASGPNYADVVRAANAAGEPDLLIVPVIGGLFIGGRR